MPDVTNQAMGVGRPQTTRQVLPPVNPFLGLLPVAYWNRIKDYFAYTIEWLPLNASATTVGSVGIQADSDFLIEATTIIVTSSDNTTTFYTNLPLLISLTDSGSGRILSDKAVHVMNSFGTAQNPFFLPYPKVIKSNSTLSASLQNLSATAYNVRATFHGFKIFPDVQ